MQTVWNVPGRASGVNPPAFASGEPPPTLPHDPPDPTSPLSPVNFPTLTETTTNTVLYGSSRKGTRTESRSSHLTASSTDKRKVATTSSETTSMEIELETQTLSINATIPENRSETATVQSTNSETNLIQNLTIIPPKNSSPIQTNKASSATLPSFPPPLLPPHVPVNSKPVSSTSGLAEKPTQNQTLVEKLRASVDNTLRRLAPITIAPSGRPRVVIPDTVLKKGAEIHKDFIICYFNGKSPPSGTRYWGKAYGMLETQCFTLLSGTLITR